MAEAGSIAVTVRPGDRVLQLESGEKLLSGFRRHDVPISYSCEDGRCGLCCCRVLNGRVIEASRPPRPLHNTRSPYVLACQSSVVADCVVRLPHSEGVVVHRQRKLGTVVLAVEEPVKDVRIVTLQVADDFTFSPGQFVELQFSRQLTRVYSVANSSCEGRLTLHIQLHPYGRASQVVANALKVGDKLRINGPLGSAYLRTQDDAPIICVASKTGLAPMLSILGDAANRNMKNEIHVYCGFMNAEQVYGQEELHEIAAGLPNLASVQCLTPTSQSVGTFRPGLLTEAINEDFERLDHYQAYLFGSPFAIESVARLMLAKRLPLEKLHADPFQITGD